MPTMRTYELHASFKQIKRSDGRSSVAASAYRSASRLIDERTGEISDYTRKAGVEASELFAPADSPEWARDRSQLWNAAEQKENRKNSMLARELEIGFPAEFNEQQRLEAGRTIALQLVKKHGVAVDVCWHSPGKEGDHRNHHAHILFTGRAINSEGWKKKKYRDFNNDMVEVDGKKTTKGKQTVKEWRADVAETFNQISRRDGLEITTEHLSFEERGLEKIPTVKLGFGASQMEKRGIETERGKLNREIKELNQLKQEIKKQEAEIINLEAERQKREAQLKEQERLSPENIEKVWKATLQEAETLVSTHKRKLKDNLDTANHEHTLCLRAEPQPPEGLFSGFKRGSYEKAHATWKAEEKRLRWLWIDARREKDDDRTNAFAIAEKGFEKRYPELAKERKRLQDEEQKRRIEHTPVRTRVKQKSRGFER